MELDPQAGAPVPATEEPQPESDKPQHSHTRTGKIARLPKKLRDQLNQMLLDGVPYLAILKALGEPASHITDKNVGDWKQGGYQDWLGDLQRNESLGLTRDSASDLLAEKAGVPVQQAGRTVAATQLYELLLSFNPRPLEEAISQKPELYFTMINNLARLCEAEAVCAHRQALLQGKLNPEASSTPRNVISAETLKAITHQTKLL